MSQLRSEARRLLRPIVRRARQHRVARWCALHLRPARKAVVLVASTTLRAAPFPSTIAGPPTRVVDGFEDWTSSASGVELSPLQPAGRVDLQSPVSLESVSLYDAAYRGFRLPTLHREPDGRLYFDRPDRFVVSLPQARVVGCSGAIVTNDDELLLRLSPEYEVERLIRGRHSLAIRSFLPRVEHVEGTVAVLATLADRFFSHWMMDMLPRIALLLEAGYDPVDFDAFYLRKPETRYELESLEAAGVPVDRIVDCRAHPHVRADTLVVTSPLREVFEATELSCKYLNSLFGPTLADSTRASARLYVSRRNAAYRRIVNEPELLSILKPLGFTSIEPHTMSLHEQARTFACAEAIVAPHGSAFANFVYCRPGTTLLEIQSVRGTQTCGLAIATARGCRYGLMYGDGDGSAANPLVEDMRVDPTKLIALLELLGVESR